MSMTLAEIEDDRVYTPEQVAAIVPCAKELVGRHVRTGSLNGFAIGPRLLRVVGRNLKDWIAREGHLEQLPPVIQRRSKPATLATKMAAAIAAHSHDGGHVYFIQCGRFVKVGYTKMVEVRFQSLQSTNPFELDLLGSLPASFASEKALHRLLAAHHHRHEWFHLKPSLGAAIRELCG